SICLLSLSANLSDTSPVASSNPYEELTGDETDFPFDRSSTRTLGGSIRKRLVVVPAICTEKKRVVSFSAPLLNFQSIRLGGPADLWPLAVSVRTGMISSCGDSPPWK